MVKTTIQITTTIVAVIIATCSLIITTVVITITIIIIIVIITSFQLLYVIKILTLMPLQKKSSCPFIITITITANVVVKP